MNNTYQIVSQIVNGEEFYVNQKMCEDIEIDLNDIACLSDDSKMRYIGLNKRGIFKLTRKSWTKIRKDLMKRGILWRFDYSHRK